MKWDELKEHILGMRECVTVSTDARYETVIGNIVGEDKFNFLQDDKLWNVEIIKYIYDPSADYGSVVEFKITNNVCNIIAKICENVKAGKEEVKDLVADDDFKYLKENVDEFNKFAERKNILDKYFTKQSDRDTFYICLDNISTELQK